MGDRVRITDVAPRDGLQNEPVGADGVGIGTEAKAGLVRALDATGVDEIEVTSFVSPKWVPQLGDAAELCRLVAPGKRAGVVYSALVPNERGMERLLEANEEALAADGRRVIDKASVFTAASETFSQKNTNATIAETLDRFGPVLGRAQAEGLATRAYVSCAIACPYEGAIAPADVAWVAERLVEMGFEEIDLGDTIGAGTPATVGALLREVAEVGAWGKGERVLTLHLHDTFGGAAECVKVALDLGVRSFDGSVGGLGGCPYASRPGRRAPGNVDTGVLVATIEEPGFETGVDRARLGAASARAAGLIRGSPGDSEVGADG